ncbi:MAG: hypothetical protein M1829_004670 [Trizodia sp. TS-e1964]|nr:MAG: hypothetical protein M1829_004670 [Trizodia sp. TS-e1964]
MRNADDLRWISGRAGPLLLTQSSIFRGGESVFLQHATAAACLAQTDLSVSIKNCQTKRQAAEETRGALGDQLSVRDGETTHSSPGRGGWVMDAKLALGGSLGEGVGSLGASFRAVGAGAGAGAALARSTLR